MWVWAKPKVLFPVEHFKNQIAQGGVQNIVGVGAVGNLRAEVERGSGFAVNHRKRCLSTVPAEFTDR